MTTRFRVTTWMAFADFFAAIAVISICLFGVYQRPGRLTDTHKGDDSTKVPPVLPPKPAKTIDEYRSKRIEKRLISRDGPLEALQNKVGPKLVKANRSTMQVTLLPVGSFDFRTPVPSQLNDNTKALLTGVSGALFEKGLLRDWNERWKLDLVRVNVHAIGSSDDESQYLSAYSRAILSHLQAEAARLGISTRLGGFTADFRTKRAAGQGSIVLVLVFDLSQDGQIEAKEDYEANKEM